MLMLPTALKIYLAIEPVDSKRPGRIHLKGLGEGA